MPRLDRKTRDRVLQLHFRTDGKEPLNAREILDTLQKENDESGTNYVIPNSERSIQKLLKKIREQESETIALERQPWSLAINEKAGIPFDPVLFELTKAWFRLRHQKGIQSEYVPFPVGIAKWAVRLHTVAPYLTPEELLRKARAYYAKDRLAALADALPDSSFEDLEISMQNEKNPETRKAYQESRGKTIVKQTEESQTDQGDVNILKVPDEFLTRLSARKRGRRKK
jgi:hypothetical protein